MPANRSKSRVWPLLALITFLLPAVAAAQIPASMQNVHYDWVCVTDAALVDAYQPLADHRAGQGLAPLVVPLDEVIRWSPAGDDTIATLRWLARTAVDQWGAEYLLLGGSHALLPAPMHLLSIPTQDYLNPIDAYYRCLDGEWDVDQDGLYAEWEDDAADPNVHIALGRIPADDAIAVGQVVAKILAYEARSPESVDRALFVASLMDPQWNVMDPYPNWSLNLATALRDSALALRPSLRAGTLFQDGLDNSPVDDALNPASLVDSLGARPHDLVYLQLHGAALAWELAGYLAVTPPEFDSLENSGHSFLATMLSGSVADTREGGILQHLMTMAGGGAAGVIAPTGLGYITPFRQFQDILWTRMLDSGSLRLGEAFRHALQDRADAGAFNIAAYASSYWYLALLGDPATELRPALTSVGGVPMADIANLRAVPNPFNPLTVIHFDVEGPTDRGQPVRVEIFDLRGRKVATLLDGDRYPGPQAVAWEAGSASGLYFARVTVGGHHRTLKLTLLE